MRRFSGPRVAALSLLVLLAACGGDTPSAQVVSTAPIGGAPADGSPTTTDGAGTSSTEPSATPSSDPASPTSVGSVPSGPGTLRWRDCDDRDGFQCATLTVPVDYSNPGGDTLPISVNRHVANDRTKRIGSLVVNPGGPGGSGLDLAGSLVGILPKELLDRFDLVGFDPRGVGKSRGIECRSDTAKDAYIALPDLPTTRAEIDAEVQARLDAGTGCTGAAPDLLPFLTTKAVARDLDALRAALGDDKLTYLGFSYGTHLGAAYAQLYPERVRALVLDGVVNPRTAGGVPDDEAYDQSWSPSFERAFRRFAAACVAATECAAKPDPVALRDTLLAQVTTTPLKVPGDPRTIGQGLLVSGIASPLYDHRWWPALAVALRDAANGDGSLLLSLADIGSERDASGHYATLLDAFGAVVCADRPTRIAPDQVKTDAAALALPLDRLAYDRVILEAQCSTMPVGREPFTAVGPATGSPPILLIGTDGDPATDVANTAPMAKALGVGVTLFWEGDGHTAFTKGGPCIDDAVVAYLVSLTVPADGTRCPANPPGTSNAPAQGVAYDARRLMGDILADQFGTLGGTSAQTACLVNALTTQLDESQLVRLVFSAEPPPDLVDKVRAAAGKC